MSKGPAKELCIIEHYGPVVRIGVEGKWVEFIQQRKPRWTKKELLALIAKMDRKKKAAGNALGGRR